MSETPPEPRDAPPEERTEEDAERYAGHDDPDAVRGNVGLGEQGRPEPPGAPRPAEPDTGAPTPSE